MEQLVRLQLVEFAKEDAAETLENEQASHWICNVDPNNPSHLPKALRPDGGYFDQALAFAERDPDREACWEIYQRVYADSVARGVRAIQKADTPEGDWSAGDENEILEAGSEAARK